MISHQNAIIVNAVYVMSKRNIREIHWESSAGYMVSGVALFLPIPIYDLFTPR